MLQSHHGVLHESAEHCPEYNLETSHVSWEKPLQPFHTQALMPTRSFPYIPLRMNLLRMSS
jgi:hypothetical protein